jgi:hypothetical protein
MKETDTHIPYRYVRLAYQLLVAQALYTNNHCSVEHRSLIEAMTPFMEEWDREERLLD